MKLQEFRYREEGYLLLENLVTLTVILTVLVITYPLVVDWLVTREEHKQAVEMSRVLYESSVRWPHAVPTDRDYTITPTVTLLRVAQNQHSMEVEIHAVQFTK